MSVSPADTVQDTAAVLFGGAKYILAPYATFARDTLGVKSAALIYPEGAGQDEGADGQASAFEAAGIAIKVVSYPANTPDLTVPLLAAGAQDVDLVMPVINPNDCVKFAAGHRTSSASPTRRCSPARSASTLMWPPGSVTCRKWLYAVASSLSIDPTDPSVPPYTDILTAHGPESSIGDPWVLVGFGQTMTLAKWLNTIGPDNLSTDTIVERDEGVQGSADPRLAGARNAASIPRRLACATTSRSSTSTTAPRSWEQAGDFVGPPEGWVAIAVLRFSNYPPRG